MKKIEQNVENENKSQKLELLAKLDRELKGLQMTISTENSQTKKETLNENCKRNMIVGK